MRRAAGLATVLLICLMVATPVVAESRSCSMAKVGALMRNDLALLGGCLSVRESIFRRMSPYEEQAGRAFISLLNSSPHCYMLTDDGRLVIDEQAVSGSDLDGIWGEPDLADLLVIARHVQNSKVRLDASGPSITAVWYEHQLIYSSDYHSQQSSQATAYSRHPLPVSFSTSVTHGITISGGVTVPIQTLLGWLKLEYLYRTTETSTFGPYTPLGPNNPSCPFYPRGEEAAIWYTDTHFHSSATYYQWYCTDEDVKGQVTRWYQGTYTATGFRFRLRDDRIYMAVRRPCYCAECNAAAQ
ncbi:MAG: hypothetical protein RDU89_05660 [bacterium]|nr:hypothetical protein [bacterium]